MAKKTQTAYVKMFARLWKENTAITDAMIAEGRGHELPSQTMAKTDPLSVRFTRNVTERMALRFDAEQTFGPDMVDVLSSQGIRASY